MDSIKIKKAKIKLSVINFSLMVVLNLTYGIPARLLLIPLLAGGVAVHSYSQRVAINTTGALPNASALLDVDAAPGNNMGLLIPRVALTATNSNAPIGAAVATSLLVYNTTTAGVVPNNVTPGYYYWDGAKWVQLATGSTGGSGWLLLGNAGTTAGTNFLGTTDNVSLVFKVNGIKAGQIDAPSTALYNTAFGYQALNSNTTGFNHTATGVEALYSNTTGWYNTANGYKALYSNTIGNYNTANGEEALYSNTSASDNTATGAKALYANTTGALNTATGYAALRSNTTGDDNTATGMSTLVLNTTGEQNTATGYHALYSNVSGNRNTANGNHALDDNTGDFNTAIGYSALSVNTTGNSNTALGYQAFLTGTAYANSTALGANAVMNASNKVRIGDATVTVIQGQVAYTFPSDGRFKNNVTEEVSGLDFINRLRPVVYNFDTRKFDEFLMQTMSDSLREAIMNKKNYSRSSSIRQSGFIAQEVEQAARESGYDFNGLNKPTNENDNYSIAYSLFTVPLVKAVQEQQKMIDSLKLDNKNLQLTISNLKSEYDSRLKKMEEVLNEKLGG